MKTPEKLWFFVVFRGNKMGSLVRNVLTQPIFTRKITPALPMVVAILNIILLFYIIGSLPRLCPETVRKVVLKLVCIKFFFFHQMIALQKLLKMLFISSKKLFSFSRYSYFCISVLPFFSTCQPLL